VKEYDDSDSDEMSWRVENMSTSKSVIEELDQIEEFLKWVNFVFTDGSS